APLNAEELTRATQVQREQPGCLHAGMDLYKWAGKLGPLIPGDLLLDTFELARDIREVDMQASPYDVSEYVGADGAPLVPIAIEGQQANGSTSPTSASSPAAEASCAGGSGQRFRSPGAAAGCGPPRTPPR